jgi:two-component system NtrC family sensor kinase
MSENETLAQKFLVNVPGLIYQFLRRQDGSVNFIFLSFSYREFFELSSAHGELDTTVLVSLLHPDDRQDFFDSISASAEMLQPWQWVGRCILPSGKMKWIRWDAQPTSQTNGNVFWNGLLVDITSQQQVNVEVERLSFLLGLTEYLQSSTDLREIAQFALVYLVQATNCAFGDIKIIYGIAEQRQACTLTNQISGKFIATYGEPAVAEMEVFLRQGIPYGEGLLWQVVETGCPVFVEDYANHPKAIAAFRHPSIKRLGIFPISTPDGTVIGVLTLESRLKSVQESPQQDLLLAACRILGVRIERAKDRERLAQANAELEYKSQQLRQKAQQLEQTLHELQQAQTQLIQSEKMSSLGQLVTGIAHEINNPVSFIHGNIDHAHQYFQDLLYLLRLYAQHYPQPAPDIQQALENSELDFLSEDLPKLLNSMRSGADRISDVVNSLRNFSRLDEAEIKSVDIHEGIDNTLMILDRRLREQENRPEIKVIKEYGNLPQVECYAGQLNQVFMNILTNAIEALEEEVGGSAASDGEMGGEEKREIREGSFGYQNISTLDHKISRSPIPTIWIRTEAKSDSQVTIRIADNGPGIAASLQHRIFDLFFTTKPVGKGTGLGLPISYQIVTEKHGGQLQCISAPGQGTEFAIEIPLRQTS